jgi:aspartyl aminopeptidase
MSTTAADDLLAFIDAAPTPFHAVAEAARHLRAVGFSEVDLAADWPAGGRSYVIRGGTLVAWVAPEDQPTLPFRIIGAHTDSPNLRIKPRPDLGRAGFRQLDIEPYGGLLLNSWLDRDLGLAGRVVVREGHGRLGTRLFRDDRPLLRIPQLAIHLDREISERGLLLNKQQHMTPVWGLGTAGDGDFTSWLAEVVGVGSGDVLGWDAMCHDTLPAGFLGPNEELISAPRLDNLCSSFGAVSALVAAPDPSDTVPMIALFDHEEVGSTSATGADSVLLGQVVERVVANRGGTPDDVVRACAGSQCLSADMAHGTHPNYPDRHEPNHWIELGGGPVVKTNVNLRYATDGETGAGFRMACDRVGVPVQEYAHRSDLPCGSTIGPITAARMGIATFDVGMPMLSMHSIRELMASSDVALMTTAFSAWLSG